jgi:hypothetical protein
MIVAKSDGRGDGPRFRSEGVEVVEVAYNSLGPFKFRGQESEGREGLDQDAFIIQRICREVFRKPGGEDGGFREHHKGGFFLGEGFASTPEGVPKTEAEENESWLAGGAERTAQGGHRVTGGKVEVAGIHLTAFAFEKEASIVLDQSQG